MKYIIVMGVSGCGKSTIAKLLADRLQASFIEADELHGEKNIAKMRQGHALTDEDRWPWLRNVSNQMKVSAGLVVVSCSALRREYRQFLSDAICEPIGFIHLHATYEVIASRMENRAGHFMPLKLLESQIMTLEPLEADEIGLMVNAMLDPVAIVNEAMEYILGNTYAQH